MKQIVTKFFIPHHHNHYRPHFIRPLGIFVVLAFATVLQLQPWQIKPSTGQVLAYASDINPVTLLTETNAQRSQAGLPPLRLDARLNNSAAAKATDMIRYNYWAHVSPTGVQPWYWFEQANYHYAYAGENLAMDFDTTAGVIQGWMNSPEHRANVLNPHYIDIGFAVLNGQLLGHPTTLVVAHYGATEPTAIATAKTPVSLVPPAPVPAATPLVQSNQTEPVAPRVQAAANTTSYSLVKPLAATATLAPGSQIAVLLLLLTLAIMLWSHARVWRRRLIHGYTHKYRLRAATELALCGGVIIIIIVRSFGSVS